MSRRARRSGFTLVEAVAAMVVLSIAVPAGLVALSDTSRSRFDDVQRLRAAWLAESIIETCAADAMGDGLRSNFNAMSNTGVYNADLARRIGPLFTDHYEDSGLSWSVTSVPVVVERVNENTLRALASPGLSDPDYRLFTIVVQWASARGELMSYTLETVVARP